MGLWATIQDCRGDETAILEVSFLTEPLGLRSDCLRRNVSAEIFVVCRDFVAPKHIDPKFLDPKHVFKDIAPLPASITLPPIDPSSSTSAATQASTSASAAAAARLASNSHAHANVFMPEKKRRNREGYAEGDNLLFHTALAEDFVRGTDPVALLGSMNKIVIVSEQEQTYVTHPFQVFSRSYRVTDGSSHGIQPPM